MTTEEFNPIETPIEAARSRLRAATNRREAKAAELAPLAELAEAEQAADDAEALEAAEEKHGALGTHLRTIETDHGLVILKRPNPLHYKRFRDAGKQSTEAFERLVRPCVVHPASSRFDHILDTLPATLDRCADAVVELAGFRQKESGAK